jgi:leucyl-tRNA synthetase
MSKSKGNVINPDDIIKKYGADTMRVYEMFMGPFDQAIAWDSKGVRGVRRFLQKVWQLFENQKSKIKNQNEKSKFKKKELKKLLHKTIKKVSEDIENMKFNTAVSALMEFCNAWSRLQSNRGSSTKSGQENPTALAKKDLKDFLKILSPFAPHLAEELYQRTKEQKNRRTKEQKFKSIFQERWPKYDEKLIEEEKITLIVQMSKSMVNSEIK